MMSCIKKSGQAVVTGIEYNQFENAVKSIRETENIEVRLSTPRSRIQNEMDSTLYPAS